MGVVQLLIVMRHQYVNFRLQVRNLLQLRDPQLGNQLQQEPHQPQDQPQQLQDQPQDQPRNQPQRGPLRRSNRIRRPVIRFNL